MMIPIVLMLWGSIHPAFASRPPQGSGSQVMGSEVNAVTVTNQQTKPEGPDSQAGPTVQQILSNKTFWGPAFSSVVALLTTFTDSGEQQIEVFSNQVVGSTRYRTREEAQPAIQRFQQKMKESAPARDAANGGLTSVAAGRFEDDSVRLIIQSPKSEFFSPRMTMNQVRETFGPPEKITQQLEQNERERRPVVLTLYQYAGGAVIFAESDVTPKGTLNRVLIDVPTAAAVMGAK